MSDQACQVQEKNTTETRSMGSPVDQLMDLLSSDMQCVDTEIMSRMHSDVALIPKLAGYLIASGGKRIRPLLTLASTRLFNEKTERPYPLAAAVEFIHTATLLHDDVVDGSEERRGQKAANLVFGNQASVLVGDFLFSRAFQQMVGDGSLEVLRILSDASAVIAEGEVMQLASQGDISLTLERYYKVIASKTAALFAAACEIGPVVSEQSAEYQEALRLYGYNLGMAFQIADDVLDYNADRVKLGKATGDDFREGKLTAPIILAIQKATNEEREFWLRVMQDQDQNDGDFEHAISVLKKHNSLNEGLNLAYGFADEAKGALDVVSDSPIKDLLVGLVDYTIRREF